MQSYPLDLDTILLMLGQQRQSGRLETTVDRGPGVQEPCQAFLTLHLGKVTECALVTKNGRQIAQGPAGLQWLRRLGTLEWFWYAHEEEAPHSLPETPSRDALSLQTVLALIPYPRESALRHNLTGFSRRHIRVLGLVDGKRSVSDIARLLSLPDSVIPELWTVLCELEEQGLVILRR